MFKSWPEATVKISAVWNLVLKAAEVGEYLVGPWGSSGHRLRLCGCRGNKLLRGLQGGSLRLEELPGSWRHARVFPLLIETGWEEVSSARFGVFIFVSFC